MATRGAVLPISRGRPHRTPPIALDSAERQLVQISRRYLRRAEQAHSARRAQNLINWDLYYLRQDWSHKRPWQSRVFLPDFPVAVQQIVTTLKRGLTDSDDWLDAQPVGLGDPILTEDNIRHMLLFYLDRLYMPGNRPDSARSIASALGDGLLHAVLESVITAKVYPVNISRKLYRIEQVDPKTDGGAHMLYEFGGKRLSTIDDKLVRLAIDILPFEAYLSDPGEAQLYDIHRVKRTIGQLRANPNYDPKVIDVLHGRAVKREEDQYRHRRQGTPGSYEIANPYEVVIDEFWGDAVDENAGEVLETNRFWALADSLLLRPAEVNPFWHGHRIFVSTPLARAPNAPTHPALADRVADVVRARNELDSLMLDGAFSEVWGTRQMRTDLLEDDSEVQDGVPQGYTAVLRPNVPEGLKFLERVDSGSIPQLALEMKRDLDASFQSGLGTPATAQGQLPPRSVKATEIVEVMQASGAMFEAIAATIEDDFLEPVFELAWLTLLQFVDDLREPELIQILGPELILELQDMSAAERFQLLRDVRFRVRGLRGVASRQREFTKIMTVLQSLGVSPALLELFDRTTDISRLYLDILRGAGLDPVKYRRKEEEGALGGAPHVSEQLLLAGQGGSPPAEITAAAEQRGGLESGMAPNRPAPTRA